jgi:hypothetical protein
MIETTNNIWCGIWAKDHGLSWVMWSICMYYIYTNYLCGCLFDYLCIYFFIYVAQESL